VVLTLDQVCSKEATLNEIIAYREKNRIPVLVYLFKLKPESEKGRTSYSSLWRSGQVKSGIMNKQCQADIELVQAIGRLKFNNQNSENKAYIFDCRPFINAVGNRVNGKGYLDNSSYNIFDVHFADIDNIHVMREALDELIESFGSYTGDQPLVSWFKHIQKILKGAKYVTDNILRGDSVIVNCSDGWDRTPQIISLSKILLDPYFRTIEGLRILIHFEWNGFGHKFKSRQATEGNPEASPVFLQFLDCLHQLVLHSPNRFEFNDKLLQVLAKARIENLFIEFNFDTTEQYMEYIKGHSDRTKQPCSIWSLIEKSRSEFINNSFELRKEIDEGIKNYNSLEAFFASRTYDFKSDPFCCLPNQSDYDIWTPVYNTFCEKYHKA
jgi:hypothetical protein